MLSVIWTTILVNPIFNLLALMYFLTKNLGVSIILLTVVIRTILIPFVLPSMKIMKKQRDLQPEIDALKKKYKYDKKKQAEMQMELFKKHGLNPASGCLTQIVMIIVLIALYNVISKFTANTGIEELNTHVYLDFLKFSQTGVSTSFLWLNLTKPDPFYVLAVLAGGFQFLTSKMTMPYTEAGEKAAQKTPDKKDDIAYNMQAQMLYMGPVMNFIIGLTLPSGVVLYIIATTVYSLAQTYFVSGWGGLGPWVKKLGIRM